MRVGGGGVGVWRGLESRRDGHWKKEKYERRGGGGKISGK